MDRKLSENQQHVYKIHATRRKLEIQLKKLKKSSKNSYITWITSNFISQPSTQESLQVVDDNKIQTKKTEDTSYINVFQYMYSSE